MRDHTHEATVKLGKLILTSLRQPLPPGCDLYVAAVRTMPCAVPGWRWNERIADLGPPPDLHMRGLVWMGGARWLQRWPQYKQEYLEWMTHDPCAALLTALERRIRVGQTIALACWCDTVFTCHRRLIGDELARRGIIVDWD
jgi:hypothetical protein